MNRFCSLCASNFIRFNTLSIGSDFIGFRIKYAVFLCVSQVLRSIKKQLQSRKIKRNMILSCSSLYACQSLINIHKIRSINRYEWKMKDRRFISICIFSARQTYANRRITRSILIENLLPQLEVS